MFKKETNTIVFVFVHPIQGLSVTQGKDLLNGNVEMYECIGREQGLYINRVCRIDKS